MSTTNKCLHKNSLVSQFMKACVQGMCEAGYGSCAIPSPIMLIYKTSQPTMEPTSAYPSMTPTTSPTTIAPSTEPSTLSPSYEPTLTQSPTEEPSFKPSSFKPSFSPSILPSTALTQIQVILNPSYTNSPSSFIPPANIELENTELPTLSPTYSNSMESSALQSGGVTISSGYLPTSVPTLGSFAPSFSVEESLQFNSSQV